jgi:hypothetical protein
MKAFSAVLLFAVAFLIADHAFGEKTEVWQEAKLLSFGMEHWVSTGSTQTNGAVDATGNYHATTSTSQWGHNTYQIVLDDGKMQYFAERTLSFRWQHDPHFTENSMVKFTLNGDKLTVVDDTGKEFKMKLTKRRLKE